MTSVWQPQRYELKYQLSDWILFRRTVPIIAHACTLEEILKGEAPQPPADVADYQGYVVRSAPGAAKAQAVGPDGAYLSYTLLDYQHCYIDMGGGFDAYKDKFSSKTRNTILRKVRKYDGRGTDQSRFVRYASPDEMRTFHESARHVSRLTYQERLWDLGLPQDDGFVTDMISAAERDEVRGFILYDGDRPVAYLYLPVVGRTLVYSHLGFDPAYTELSVGTVLLWKSLESLFAEGRFSYFDFTEGSSSQKLLFSTHQVPCHNRLVLRRTLLNSLSIGGHRGCEAVSAYAGRLLQSVGLKAAIKKVMRGRGGGDAGLA